MRDVSQLADHFFRHEASKLVSVLTRLFGIDRLQLAEDVVQEALMRAMRTWPYNGVPENPAAWVTQTAKNLALDVIRRENLTRNKEAAISEFTDRWSSDLPDAEANLLASDIEDAKLRLIFACCHPSLPEEIQTSLALKTLCGFSVAEISQAFLTSEAAIAKRLTRAKQRIRDEQIPLEIPYGEDLSVRLDGVLKTLYFLFNEGYKASSGESLIREEPCKEAIHLTALVCGHPAGDRPKTHAMLALMLLNGARLGGRVDDGGNILRLQDQDRSRWDRKMISEGMRHLGESAKGTELNWCHLQAGIAALHCTAPDFESTDWKQILALYDTLAIIDDSPVAALNRAVAILQVRGPSAGLEAIDEIRNRQALESYYLLYAVLAEFEMQLENYGTAAAHLRRALELVQMPTERKLLQNRLSVCEEKMREA